MKRFQCACGTRVYFENARCLGCGRELGFLPDLLQLGALVPRSDGASDTQWGVRRKCANYVEYGTCNWLVELEDPSELCRACQLNHTIPDLSLPENRPLWAEVERAKRRLIYSLFRLGLPVLTKGESPEWGLAFDVKADAGSDRVLTGHNDGLITLNLVEADTAERERIRATLRERYRTLLGHFRHEVGHYYWNLLVKDTQWLARFRALFGDETQDYGEALRRHYGAGPSQGHGESYISAYAAAHPWEDFAETFAHYLHLEDTTETAHELGFTSHVPPRTSIVDVSAFDPLIADWNDLVIVLNELNRSMGLPDAYPFAISPSVRQKLEFVHQLIGESRQLDQRAGPANGAGGR